MPYLKDDPALSVAPITPAKPVEVPSKPTGLVKLAETYNRIGGLTDNLAARAGFDPFVVLTVWLVESGGEAFIPGQPIIRFENHKFFERWGEAHAALFDRHFQFGGQAGIAGKPSQNHQFRNPPTSEWRRFHNIGQSREYEVFNFAKSIASLEDAAWSTSWGGPQIMGFNHPSIGYATASALANAFSQSERWHVCGFFDFCQNYKHGVLMGHIKNRRWIEIATLYNGDPSPTGYGKRLADTYAFKQAFDALPRSIQSPEPAVRRAGRPVEMIHRIEAPARPRAPIRRARH